MPHIFFALSEDLRVNHWTGNLRRTVGISVTMTRLMGFWGSSQSIWGQWRKPRLTQPRKGLKTRKANRNRCHGPETSYPRKPRTKAIADVLKILPGPIDCRTCRLRMACICQLRKDKEAGRVWVNAGWRKTHTHVKCSTVVFWSSSKFSTDGYFLQCMQAEGATGVLAHLLLMKLGALPGAS